MTGIDELKKLYDEGKTDEVLYKILLQCPRGMDIDMPIEMAEIKAMCHFSRGEYGEATETALSALHCGSTKAAELLIQLAAYVDKDDKTMEAIRLGLPKSPSVCNAFAIRARDADSKISNELIVNAAVKALDDDSVGATHLLNNTARLLLEKSNTPSDIVMAIGFWHIAISRYGDVNYHHRAAVYFWLSKAYEKLGDKDLAIKSARKSLTLWVKQISLDPTNQKFNERIAGAEKRLEELMHK